MVEIDEAALEEIMHEGEAMSSQDMIAHLERYHDDREGVPRDAVRAYAEELAERPGYSFDAKSFLSSVDERRTDAPEWRGSDYLYEFTDDRISQYPRRWHEHLGGSTDPVEYLRFLNDEAPDYLEHLDEANRERSVPKDVLVRLIEVLGQVERDVAVGAIEAARDEGAVLEEPDQHPQADVFLAEDADERDER